MWSCCGMGVRAENTCVSASEEHGQMNKWCKQQNISVTIFLNFVIIMCVFNISAYHFPKRTVVVNLLFHSSVCISFRVFLAVKQSFQSSLLHWNSFSLWRQMIPTGSITSVPPNLGSKYIPLSCRSVLEKVHSQIM